LYGVSALLVFLEAMAPMAQPQAVATFEVASVKRSAPGLRGFRGGCHGIDSVYTPGEEAEAPPLGRCVIADARLSHLVSIAWRVGSMRWIESGQDWIARGDERFNVEAKAENPTKTTQQQLLAMLQALLVERFDMKFHRKTVEIPGFVLVVGKTGPKLQSSKSNETLMSVGKPIPGEPSVLRARRFSMSDLVDFLTTGGYGPGVDHTDLSGVYDFTLSWDDDNEPKMETAMQEQLGLRMSSEKVPVSYFVIDSAKRPSEN
jgi:uncharacterized protein (TIGR03435 family)